MPIPAVWSAAANNRFCTVILLNFILSYQQPRPPPENRPGVSIEYRPPVKNTGHRGRQLVRPQSPVVQFSGASLATGQPRIANRHNRLATHSINITDMLVAAIRPKSYGSSTIGIKKSVVLMMPVPLPISYTRRIITGFITDQQIRVDKFCPCSPCRMVSSTREILQPQPAP